MATKLPVYFIDGLMQERRDPSVLAIYVFLALTHRHGVMCYYKGFRAPPQYPIRRLSVRSRKVSKPRYLYLELSDRSEI